MSDENFFGPAQMAALQLSRMSGRTTPPDPEELKVIKRRAESLKKMMEDEVKPDYKIEVQFSKGRSMSQPSVGILMVYRGGSLLGGGGDEVLYPCPDDKCKGYIATENIDAQNKQCVCPSCSKVWKTKELREMRVYKLPVEQWARVLTEEFFRCHQKADVVLKMRMSDIRSAALASKVEGAAAEKLYSSRSDRVVVVYSLKALIRDLDGTNDVEKRMLAFLRA